MHALRNHFSRHRRFYIAAALGLAVWGATDFLAPALSNAFAGNAFFSVYLVLMAIYAFRTTPKLLRASAKVEDEGIGLIILITIAVIALSLSSIFELLNEKTPKPDTLRVAAFIASAPLGWFMLHTVAAYHYAHRYYHAEKPGEPVRGLKFPDSNEPGIWDFLYYSFVIGMTAQVSDVQIVTTGMRQLTLAHSVVSFFYNTVLIALAVNVVVVLA